jgi:hypothetical protein
VGLSVQAVGLERDAVGRLRSRSGGDASYDEVLREVDTLAVARAEEEARLRAAMGKIRDDVAEFQSMLRKVLS